MAGLTLCSSAAADDGACGGRTSGASSRDEDPESCETAAVCAPEATELIRLEAGEVGGSKDEANGVKGASASSNVLVDGKHSSSREGDKFDREGSAHTSARPQLVTLPDGTEEEVWPQHWGVTIEQFRELLTEVQASQEMPWQPENTVTQLVKNYVIPMTAKKGVGYALLRNGARPLEVNVMVSHAWGENAELFCERLERTVSSDDVMFICALSLYQCEDASGPTILQQLGASASDSPFNRVLSHIKRKGDAQGLKWKYRTALTEFPSVLFASALTIASCCIVYTGCMPFPDGHCQFLQIKPRVIFAELQGHYRLQTRELPPGFELLLPFVAISAIIAFLAVFITKRSNIYRGRMVVVPNRNCDIYSRLWCVYEIFVATQIGVPIGLAQSFCKVGEYREVSCSREARCSSLEDRDRIRAEIENWGEFYAGEKETGYDLVDMAILRLRTMQRRTTMILVLKFLWPFSMLTMGKEAVLIAHGDNAQVHSLEFMGVILAGTVCSFLLFSHVRRNYGRPRLSGILAHGGLQLLVGTMSYYGLLMVHSHTDVDSAAMLGINFAREFFSFVAVMGMMILAILFVSIHAPMRLIRIILRPRLKFEFTALMVIMLSIAMGIDTYSPRDSVAMVVGLLHVMMMVPLAGIWYFAASCGVHLQRPLLS